MCKDGAPLTVLVRAVQKKLSQSSGPPIGMALHSSVCPIPPRPALPRGLWKSRRPKPACCRPLPEETAAEEMP
jgi:hypothetical protein